MEPRLPLLSACSPHHSTIFSPSPDGITGVSRIEPGVGVVALVQRGRCCACAIQQDFDIEISFSLAMFTV